MISLILALVMVFSLAIPAMAAETTVNSSENGSNTSSQDVTASYTPTITNVSITLALKAVDSTGTEALDAIGYFDGLYAILTTSSEPSVNSSAEVGNHTLTSWHVPTGYMTPADVILSITDEDGDGIGEVSTTSSHAKVELVDGVYVITVTLEKATEVSFQAMLSAVDADGAAVTGYLQTMFEGYQLDNSLSSSLTMNTGTYNLTFDVSDEDTLIPEGYKAPADITLSITSDGTVNGIVTSSNATVTEKTVEGETVYVITVTLEKATEVSFQAKLSAVDADGAAVSCDLGVLLYGSYLYTNGVATTYDVIETGNHTLTNWSSVPTGYMTPADVSLSITDEDGDGNGEVSTTSSHAQVALVDGVYVITVTLEEGSTEPTTAVIDGVSITVDNVTYTSGTVILTPNSGDVTIIVSGSNLQNATSDHYVIYSSGLGAYINTMFTISGDGTTATCTLSASDYDTSYNFELEYSNNFNATDPVWTSSGIYVTHTDAIPEIEGLSITVDGTPYTTGNVTIKPDTQSIIITVTGTNLQNATMDNLVWYSSAYYATIYDGTIAEDGTTATLDFRLCLSHFATNTTAHELQFSNDGGDSYTGTGLYVIYQSESVSVEITWGAMSFTYSDEQVNGADKGWTCEDGANKITVTNSGTVAVNAAVSYTKAEGYDWLSGSFQNTAKEAVTNADVAVSGSFDFYLILSGTPTEAFSGTVGSVTVTITKVSTPEQITPEENTPDDGSTDTGSDTDSDAGVF